jgi:hypothetical protein
VNLLGVDPGRTGALARFANGVPELVVDMPLGVHGVDGLGVWHLLLDWQIDEAFIESSHAMPANGSKAAYSQGDSNGALRTAIAIAGIPLTWVRPAQWQAHANLSGWTGTATERKHRSRMRAQELMPTMVDYLDRAKDHNRAEALLIGRYGCATSILQAVVDGS